MTKWKAALFGLAAATAFSTAAAADRPILPVSRALDAVEACADFGKLAAVHYDLAEHDYQIMYTTKTGGTKSVAIDAANGGFEGDPRCPVAETSAAAN